jgi:hypothetical protein
VGSSGASPTAEDKPLDDDSEERAGCLHWLAFCAAGCVLWALIILAVLRACHATPSPSTAASSETMWHSTAAITAGGTPMAIAVLRVGTP